MPHAPKPKIALPRTEMTAQEFIDLLTQACFGNEQESIAAHTKLHALRHEIDTNRDKLLGEHAAN